MNSDSTRGELVRMLRGAGAGIKQAAKWLCEKVNEGSSKFMSKTLLSSWLRISSPVVAAAAVT